MATKSNKKGPLGQDPSHMGNPIKAFREGGQKRMAAYKKGGYNTPTQNALPKRFMGGDDPMNPSGMARPNIISPNISNPFVKGDGLNNNTSSVTPRPVSTTSVVPSPAPVTVDPVIPAPVPVAPVAAAPVLSAKERIAQAKADARIAKIEGRSSKNTANKLLKEAKTKNLTRQYESDEKKAASTGEKIDRAIKVGETVIGGIDAINKLKKPGGGGSPAGGGGGGGAGEPFNKGGMVTKKKKYMTGGAKPKAIYGMAMKPGMMKSGGKVTTKKMGMGGMHAMPDGSMMKDSMMSPMKKGGVKKTVKKHGN